MHYHFVLTNQLCFNVLLAAKKDMDFLMMGGGRALLRALAGILFPDLRTVLSANMVRSLEIDNRVINQNPGWLTFLRD